MDTGRTKKNPGPIFVLKFFCHFDLLIKKQISSAQNCLIISCVMLVVSLLIRYTTVFSYTAMNLRYVPQIGPT
jgi:hypothetical protein